MKCILLNSAMMPKEGTYRLMKISLSEFKFILRYFYKKGQLEPYIGYQQNIDLIEKWTGIKLPLVREEVTGLEDGDILLIMKLKYRLKDPSLKGVHIADEEDFEFYVATYSDEVPDKIPLI